jgi:hypothetical protein
MTYTIFNTFRPYDFGTDAIERQRVSLGQSIIDADFEYGLQGTKWQAYQEVRKTPGFFEIPGTDLTVTNVVSDGAAGQSLIEVSVTPAPGVAGSFVTGTNMVQTLTNATATTTVGTPVAGRTTIMVNVQHYITPGLTFLVEIAGVSGGTTGTLNGTHTATSIGYYNYTIATPAGASGTFTLTASTSKFLTAIGFLQSGSATNQVTNGQYLTGTVLNNTITGVVTLAGWGSQIPGGQISGTILYSNQTWITGTLASSTTLSTTSGFNPQHMQGFEPNGTVTTAAVAQSIANSAGTLTISKSMTVTTTANHNVATGTVMTVQITGTTISAGAGILDGIYTATASAANQFTIDATTYGANGVFTMTGSTTKFLTHIGVPIQNPTNMGTSYQITNTGTLTMVAPPALTTVTTISNHGIPIGSTFTVFLTGTGNGVLNATAFRATSTAVNQYTITIPTAAGTGGIAVGTSCFFPMLAGVYSSTGTPITVNAAPSTTTITTSNPHNIPIGMTFSFTITGTTRASGTTDTVLNGTYTGISTATNTFTFISLNTSSSTWNTPGSNFQLFMPSAVTSLAKYIGGSINIIQTTAANNPPFSAPIYTISYAQQTWLTATIPALETFIAVSTATPGTQPYTANVVSISGLLNVTKTADRAEGYFPLLGVSTGNNLAYLAKGLVAGGQLSTSYTIIRRGGLFNNGNARLQGITSISQTSSPNTVTVTTAAPHGLIPGTPISVVGWLSAGGGVNGNYFLETVPTTTTFTYTPQQAAVQTGIVGGYIFVQTYSSAVHRPFDGGVLLAAGQPSYGSNIVRQSKKVFRYQSGKGLLWSSGTLFCPNNDIVSISSAGTAIGSLMAIVSEVANGLPQAGARVQVTGVTSTGFNTVGSSFYTINNVIESTTASMLSLNTISGLSATTVSSITFTGDGTTATATATAHGFTTGLAVAITSASVGAYNTAGVVITVTGPNTFTYLSGATGAATGGVATTYRAVLSDQSRFIMRNWHGSSVRAGCFEDQNGLFWEYDGQTLFVVKRTSTFQLTGLVSCTYLGQTLTGNSDTRFQDQLRIGDRFVIRGMAHTVTNITSQSSLSFNPPYRGTVEITTLSPVRACKVKDVRVPQSQFNRDKLDGTGNSGFTANVAKMQMVGIQYTWYGAGFVDFMMRGLDGNWVMAHRIYNNNVNDEAYMRTGNLPVRYELTNECGAAISTLASQLNPNPTSTAITLADPDNTLLAYWPTTGTVLIDNELISYTGKTTTQLTGLTRSTSLTYNIADTNRTFTGSATLNGDTHTSGTSVNLVSSTCTPSLTHWGSALLMDGQFDNDRGYFFNYTFNQAALTASTSAIPLFFLRLSPSVSNGIVGDMGARDLLNRAQLLLQKLDCSVVGSGTTLNINGILNPVGFENSTFPWININSIGQGSQPSFTQYCNYNTLTLNGGSYVPGSGERIFSLVAQGGSVSTIDLSALKELSNTVIGGNRMFPDGPDTLMIVATALNANLTNAVLNLYWTEAQA